MARDYRLRCSRCQADVTHQRQHAIEYDTDHPGSADRANYLLCFDCATTWLALTRETWTRFYASGLVR